MTRWICILLLGLLVVTGCKKKQQPAPASKEEPKLVHRVPLHLAEIHMVRRSSSGQSSVTMTLSSSHTSETRVQKQEALSITSKQWETIKTELNFELDKGRKCKMSPAFLEHKDGNDIWKIDLQYTTTQKHEGAEFSETSHKSNTVAFDGSKPLTISEDDHHTIIIRPRKINSEHEDSNRPADAVD
jgi:hypothetical protein